jgi:hypothetical protein
MTWLGLDPDGLSSTALFSVGVLSEAILETANPKPDHLAEIDDIHSFILYSTFGDIKQHLLTLTGAYFVGSLGAHGFMTVGFSGIKL